MRTKVKQLRHVLNTSSFELTSDDYALAQISRSQVNFYTNVVRSLWRQVQTQLAMDSIMLIADVMSS